MSTRTPSGRQRLSLAAALLIAGCTYHSVDPAVIAVRDGGQDVGQDVAQDFAQDIGQDIGHDAPAEVVAEAARPDAGPDMIMCGNGVREPGETCEPIAECTRQQMACQGDRRTVRTGKGSPTSCTFVCESSPRACGPADGFCLPGCTSDPDCSSPLGCAEIQFCTKPTAPNQGSVVCLTDKKPCTANQRIYECTVDAREVCGDNHAKPVLYVPPIDGLSSG